MLDAPNVYTAVSTMTYGIQNTVTSNYYKTHRDLPSYMKGSENALLNF